MKTEKIIKQLGLEISPCEKIDCSMFEVCRKIFYSDAATICFHLGNIHLCSRDITVKELVSTITHETIHYLLHNFIENGGIVTCLSLTVKLDQTDIWEFIYGERLYWRK